MRAGRFLVTITAVLYTALLIIIVVSYRAGLKQVMSWRSLSSSGAEISEKEAARAARNIRVIRNKIEAMKPRGPYIVVDSGQNRLYLMSGEKIVREAIVSCGSGEVLQDPKGKRKWVFDTPRGEFAVKSKIRNPYWVKPDWAFIEEGEPIPKNREDRIEAGTLGDYAIGFGDGFFIHGTLYTRLLGRNVTHGCIRVGDEDLKAVFNRVQIGSKIFIY